MNTVLMKPCETCGISIVKPPSCSRVNWPARRFCSYRCMGIANRGKPSWNKGLSRSNAHTPRSAEWKAKMSAAQKGVPRPQRRGPNHHNWKNGISKSRRDMRESAYIMWREAVFARDDHACQQPGCGQRGGDLESHHIETWSARPDLRYDSANGVTLCKRHHAVTKGHEPEFAALFRQVVGYTRS